MIRLSRPDADLFVPDGKDPEAALARTTHLAIGAHQDDAEFMALHGILECFNRPDRWFANVVVTNGAGSPRAGVYANYTDEQMRAIRVREQRKAASIGEYGCQVQLMHPSSAVKDPAQKDVAEDLRRIMEIADPDVAYLHNPADKHDTHVAVMLRSLAAIRALPAARRPQKVYGCEIWRDLDWLMDDDKQALRVDAHKNLAAALSGIFDSQITGGKRYDLAIMGRRTANATFHESHKTDVTDALSWAVDLTPLVQDGAPDVTDYILGLVDRFRSDVRERLAKLSGRA